MVKTRRKNYIYFRDVEKGNIPMHFIMKKPSPKACKNNKKLLDFSTEILIKITSHLSLDSLKNLRLVCRRLNEVSVVILTKTTKTIIARYREFVKFSPSNLHPDIDACCVLSNLCLLDNDMKICKDPSQAFFPITIQIKAVELLKLMAERTMENLHLKEERTRELVRLVHKMRCLYFNSIPKRSLISNDFINKKPKYEPITYP